MDAFTHESMESWMHGYIIEVEFGKHYFSTTYELNSHECMDAWMVACMEASMHVCMDAL
jgi:hypothetical protein